MSSNQRKTVKIGLALGGGGARGGIHIGILRGLEELNIQPDIITGTSIGALVGALYAAGLSIDELKSFFAQMSLTQMYAFPGNAPSISQSSKLEALLEKTIQRPIFSDFAIDFSVVATDIVARKQMVLGNGDVISAVLASMAFPGMLPPVERDGYILMDGGILNNVPFDIVRARGATYTIGIDLSNSAPYDTAIDEPRPDGLMARALAMTQKRPLWRVLSTISDILTTQSVNFRLASSMPDLMLRPNVETIGIFDMHRVNEMIDRGYETILDYADELTDLGVATPNKKEPSA